MSERAPLARAVTSGPKHHFFGYFDKCPWDAEGRRLLAHEVGFNDRPPGAEDEAVLGVVDLDADNRFEPVARTTAWNFQQGAMLQWLGPDWRRRIAYNRRDGTGFVGVILDLETGQERALERPIAALARHGRHALSLSFARLGDMRPGYGYAGGADPWAREAAPEGDGIHLIDIESGSTELIVSTAAAAACGENRAPSGAKQWLNHVLFNPDGDRFCFVHRWRDENGAIVTRLLTASLDGSDLYCLSDAGMVSHFDWYDGRRLLAWARGRSSGGGGSSRLVRIAGLPLFKRPPLSWALGLARRTGAVGWTRQRLVGDRFILFTDRSQESEPIGVGQLAEDGHCTYSPDGRWILMDTYPHEDHMRRLLLYDAAARRRLEVGRFHSMNLPEEIRCDLHARFDRAGRQVCIDSTHEGSRQVYILDLGSLIGTV